MDEFQLELAEKIFQKVRETQGIFAVEITDFVLTREEQHNSKKFKGVKLVIDVLIDARLLVPEYKSAEQYLKPSPFSLQFGSYSDFLKYQEDLSNKQKEKELKEERKYDLEIKNLQSQIDQQKTWFWRAVAVAVIAELIRIYFSLK